METRKKKGGKKRKIENGKKYYYKNGEKQRGIINIDGKRYYLKWYTYDLYTEGWLYFIPYDKYVYTDRTTGEFLTGENTVSAGKANNGKYLSSGKYQFDSNGHMIKKINEPKIGRAHV